MATKFKEGATVVTTSTKALGQITDNVRPGMKGIVIVITNFDKVNYGVRLGARFVGHDLDGTLPKNNGYYFYANELESA